MLKVCKKKIYYLIYNRNKFLNDLIGGCRFIHQVIDVIADGIIQCWNHIKVASLIKKLEFFLAPSVIVI